MQQILQIIFIATFSVCFADNAMNVCSNGIFKCVSPVSLRLCFHGTLISSELFCPDFSYCSEDSDNICVPHEVVFAIPNSSHNCTKEGMFPIENSCCTKYLKCLKKPNSFLPKELECRNGQLFDPVSELCSSNYTCPEVCKPMEIPECTQNGKLPIPNTGCLKYVICKETSSGIQSTVKNCFMGSFFNPTLGRCDRNYECTDSEIPINTTPTTTQSISSDLTISDPTESPSTPTVVCTEPGKYPVLNSDCKKYRLCTQTVNGFVSQVYECPSGTLFNPDTHRCTTAYSCLDLTTTSDEPTSISTEIITNATNTPVENSTDQSSTVTTTTVSGIICNSTVSPQEEPTTTIKDDVSTITSTENSQNTTMTTTGSPEDNSTVTNDTEEPSDISSFPTIKPTEGPQNFCTAQGKFPLPNSNCKKFIYCILTTDGFKEQINECSDKTNFDPLVKKCTENYICAESDTTVIIGSTSTPKPGVCVAQGKFPVPNSGCKKFIACTLTTSGFKTQEYDCENDFLFDPVTKKCTKNYKCNETTEPLVITTEASMVCQEQDEFPVKNSGCKKYLLCVSTINGYIFVQHECPDGSLYDPNIRNCSTSYVCEESIENINTDCFEDNEHIFEPECVKEGRFPVLKTKCNKYILCVDTLTGYKGNIYECPTGTGFDPDTQRCIKSYLCLEVPKDCKTTSTNEQTTELTPVESNCIAEGRMAIPGTNCKNFLLCMKTVAKGFVSAVYTCPGSSVFSPENGRCTENHICGENTRASKIKCATVGRYPDLYDKNCEYYYLCVEKSEQNIEGIRKQCKDGYYFDPEIQQCSSNYICHSKRGVLARSLFTDVISPRFLVNGRCTTVGRYMVELTNCKNYIYCYANPNGTLTATNFTCPTTTVFNQAIQKCTAAYTCPDNFCISNPGLISWANPNVRDCSSYIDCEPVWNQFGMLLGYKGVIKYCPTGMYFNPILSACDAMYICPNT